jgi:8-oxo-dGTP pyrophosphatase MutT (NUDIX family)
VTLSNDGNGSLVTKSISQPYLVQHKGGWFEYQMPLSMKGILIHGNDVLLVGNARGELELPGGKLELSETPENTVRREIQEETGVEVLVHGPVHAWVYEIAPERHVFVLAYGASLPVDSKRPIPEADPEVGHAGWVSIDDLGSRPVPEPYRVAIKRWAELAQVTGNR